MWIETKAPDGDHFAGGSGIEQHPSPNTEEHMSAYGCSYPVWSRLCKCEERAAVSIYHLVHVCRDHAELRNSHCQLEGTLLQKDLPRDKWSRRDGTQSLRKLIIRYKPMSRDLIDKKSGQRGLHLVFRKTSQQGLLLPTSAVKGPLNYLPLQCRPLFTPTVNYSETNQNPVHIIETMPWNKFVILK